MPGAGGEVARAESVDHERATALVAGGNHSDSPVERGDQLGNDTGEAPGPWPAPRVG